MNFYQSRRIFMKTVCSLRLLSRSRSQKLNDGYAHRLSQRYPALSHSARLPLSSRQHTTWKTTNVSSEGRLSENITGICFTASRWYSTDLPVDDVNIDVTQLVSIMEKGDPYLIDIREPQELAESGSIAEAVNIPLGELESALEMAPPAYKSLYGREKPDATKATVILFCARGNRSYRAVMLTRELGFKSCTDCGRSAGLIVMLPVYKTTFVPRLSSWHLVKGFNYWKECQEQE